MKAISITPKSITIFVYCPIIISILWGFISSYNNWDQKHLDSIFAVWPLISISSVFLSWIVNANILSMRKQAIALITGVIYIIVIYILFILKLLPLKNADSITNFFFIIFAAGYFMALLSLFFEGKFRSQTMAMVYNLQLILVIATALLGYLLLFVALTKVIYYFC